jgi:excisionase family DNA binding protein
VDINDILTLQELADYLKIAPKTVSRMIQRGEIPCMKIAGQWRFRKTVIDAWLTSKMTFSEEHQFASLMSVDSNAIQLSRLITSETTLMHLKSRTIEDTLIELTSPLITHGYLDSTASLVSRLLAREHMVTTAIGFGTAFPHIRNVRENSPNLPPIIMGISHDGVDFGCLDGSKTHVFFLLLACSETAHLRLLSRLARFSQKEHTLHAILQAQTRQEIHKILMEEDYESLAQPAQ